MPFITEQLWGTINNGKGFLMNQLYENHKINSQFTNSQSNVKNLIRFNRGDLYYQRAWIEK